MLRSLLLTLLWSEGTRRGPVALVGWPWLLWLWQGAAAGWPELSPLPAWRAERWLLWQRQRLLLLGYASLVIEYFRPVVTREGASHLPTDWLLVALGCQQCGREEPWAEVTRQADGGYQATLCGHFTLPVAGDDPVRARLLTVFLRQLETAGPGRGSRPFSTPRGVAGARRYVQQYLSMIVDGGQPFAETPFDTASTPALDSATPMRDSLRS